MKKYEYTILLATVYLLIYTCLFQASAPVWLLSFLFLLSPIPVIIMVYHILKKALYNGPELGNDEFGYQDADKTRLGMF